jgi:hypothetical protein
LGCGLLTHSSTIQHCSALPVNNFTERGTQAVKEPQCWAGWEGQELAEEKLCPVGTLVIVKVAVAQEHLLPGFEGWHPEVGAAGTAEGIAQVALGKENRQSWRSQGQKEQLGASVVHLERKY